MTDTGTKPKPKPKSMLEGVREAMAAIRVPVQREEPPPPPARRKYRPKPPKPLRPVDGLGRVWPTRDEKYHVLGPGFYDVPVDPEALQPYQEDGRTPSTVMSAPIVKVRPAVTVPNGPAEMLERLNKAGVSVKLTADGQRLYLVTAGGALDQATVDVVHASARLLVAALRGEPLLCELEHDGPPPQAVSLLAADSAAACAEHAGRDATKARP